MERHKMLTIPLKTTKPFDLSGPLNSHLTISKKLPHPAQCRDGLMRISALRNCLSSSICTRVAHANAVAENALRDLMEYHAALLQLDAMGFPAEDGKILGLQVEWECAFRKGEEKTVRCNFLYERACVLFDIAAMESYIASQSDLSTKETLKSAIHSYNTAAGIFSHVRQNVINLDPNPSTDLTSVCLEMCEAVMSAQAQACIYDLAGASPTPNHSVLAKLAAGVAELYAAAFSLCQDRVLAHMTEYDSWTNHLQTKKFLFKALAEYHQGVADRSVAKYGAEIVRLDVAIGLCDKAASYSGMCDVGSVEIDAFKRMMQQRKLVAERENKEVFKDVVPSSRNIQQITAHRMAKPLPLQDSVTKLSKPLFSDPTLRPRIL